MATTIGRLRTMGIAAQSVFGTRAATASFVIPLTNSPEFTTKINKVMNEAALGSAYTLNDIDRSTRFTEISLEFKVDEDQFPLFFKQRFTIASVTTTVSNVLRHTLSYTNNTNCWYTLFLQDSNLQNYVVQDALFDNHDITFDQDFVRFSSSLVGAYPSATSVINTVTQPKEFLGRMVSFLDAEATNTLTATTVLGITSSLEFGINSDATRFGLGSQDLAVLSLTSDKFMFNISQVKATTSRYVENETIPLKQLRVSMQSTDRFLSTTTLTRPAIQFDVPRAKMENYTEEGDLDELIKENFDLTALRTVGVAGTPMSLTVLNTTISY